MMMLDNIKINHQLLSNLHLLNKKEASSRAQKKNLKKAKIIKLMIFKMNLNIQEMDHCYQAWKIKSLIFKII
jgi:hypothetical protein